MQVANIFGAIGIAGAIVQGLLIGVFSKKLGLKKMLLIGCPMVGIGLAIIPLPPNIEWFYVNQTIASLDLQNILINSNFNCGFYINREALYDLLKYKYKIHAIYDPCSYPGIQCKFYYNPDIGIQCGSQISEENKSLYKNINQVSFMIFRTGSVLIVGMCEEDVLIEIYNFLKLLLLAEFENVCQGLLDGNHNLLKDKKKKIRKKTITILENECK